jgi:uncharacterized cupredoxin-like copper-binding protein
VVAPALCGWLVACGGSSEPHQWSARDRFVDVVMRDIAYDPGRVDVARGETVTFVFHNTGKVVHDAFLGDEAAQTNHEQEMGEAGMAGMTGMDHHDGSGTTVQPGQVVTLTHTFREAGSTIIGCHEPGHYQAGMKMTVRVR